MTTTLIANRYEVIDQLGAGGMGVVWLVRDKLRDQQVALKQVRAQHDVQRLALTREFRTLSTLRHPNIVSVIEYGIHENQPYFTMEYLPDAQAFGQSSERKIEHVIQVLQALGYLHRRGILHRDLKPGNVMITADGVVKVLDFGLALDTGRDPSGEIVGTVHYMAPELFMEKPASVGSDLWALGVMICEIETNRYPFQTTGSLTDQIIAIVSNPPDLSGLDDELARVVERMLTKDPAQRYTSALDVIHALRTIYNIESPLESQSQRESFLQAAAFVGREREYHTLSDALKTAAGGACQLWLIGGEAGVGKSRLLDELRTRALVDGFVVLQGQAVESGAMPYQLWREMARKLVIGAPMSDLTASVLKELVPDIAALLGRDVADPAPLDPKANRDRLMAALLERLAALDAPVLMILEDLHWAHDKLPFLTPMLPHLEHMPIMIVGSYRDEERPTLPEELPDAALLTLERLTPEAIAALSASMIGAENATAELVERVAEETEGNALFMVEVMRALAEEAGSLHQITRRSLPARILAGGIIAVLGRRLAKVPEAALETLKLAAVIGRVIDLPVLKAAGVTQIDEWLQTCADAAILEPYQGEWRFSHDRLREVLLRDLDHLAVLHETAALALEAVYPDNVDYAEALIKHWGMAGNAEREVHYILKAVEHLVMIRGDYERAETLVQRGLELGLAHVHANLLLWKGWAAEEQGQYAEALDSYQSALATDPDPTLKIRLLLRMGDVMLRQGNYDEAKAYAQGAQALGGSAHEQAGGLLLLGLVARYQGDYETARAHYEASLNLRRQIGYKRGIADSLNNLGVIAMHQGDYETARAYYEDSLHIRREIGQRQGMALALLNLGVIAAFQGEYVTARTHFEGSLGVARQIGSQSMAANMLLNLGAVAQTQGDHVASRAYVEEGLQLYRKLGEQHMIAIGLHNLGTLTDYEGDFEAARPLFEECLAVAREIGSPETIIYGTSGLAITLIQSGERESVRELLVECIQNAQKMAALPTLMYALLASVYWSEDDEQTAAWIGLLHEQGGTDIKDDVRFKRRSAQMLGAMGEAAFNAAFERGKTLDAWAVAEEVLAGLQPSP